MNPVRNIRWAGLALLLVAPQSPGADIPKSADALKWDIGRITSPESLAEMKALQFRVKEVNKQALPSTVGLLVGMGAGSGVIVSEDGLVLTAAHVIGKPRQPITFVLADGTFVKPGDDPLCVRRLTGFEGGTAFVHPVTNEGGPDLDRAGFPRVQALGDQQFGPRRFGVVGTQKALRTIQIRIRYLTGQTNGFAVPLLDERGQ